MQKKYRLYRGSNRARGTYSAKLAQSTAGKPKGRCLKCHKHHSSSATTPTINQESPRGAPCDAYDPSTDLVHYFYTSIEMRNTRKVTEKTHVMGKVIRGEPKPGERCFPKGAGALIPFRLSQVAEQTEKKDGVTANELPASGYSPKKQGSLEKPSEPPSPRRPTRSGYA